MIYQINKCSYKEHKLGLYSLNTKQYNWSVDIEAGLSMTT